MDSILIVSSTEKSIAFFMEMLSQNSYKKIVTVSNCGEANRILIEQDFNLCIINSPLPDEVGINFAQNIISKSICQVILVVKASDFDEVAAKVENLGVLTISKPISRGLFWSALKLCSATFNKMTLMQNENKQLLQKIEDIRIVDRAKCILIEYLKMTEAEAHKYIEKQAMDMRMTRKAVAQSILKTYES